MAAQSYPRGGVGEEKGMGNRGGGYGGGSSGGGEGYGSGKDGSSQGTVSPASHEGSPLLINPHGDLRPTYTQEGAEARLSAGGGVMASSSISFVESPGKIMSSVSYATPPPPSRAKQLTVLVLVSLLPFGGHIVKNCLTALEVFMVADPRLHLTETRYGLMLSMSSLPNFFVPFFGGIFLDKKGSRFATLVFLFLILAGQVIFTIAMQLGEYNMGLFGRFVVGLGEGCVLVAQRAVISQHFRAESQVTFAIGATVAAAGLAKTLSRATVVPAAEFFGSYIGGLWYTVVMCLFSTLAGVIFIVITDEGDNLPLHKHRRKHSSPEESEAAFNTELCHIPTMKALSVVPWSLSRLSWWFWALVLQHAVYINLFHIFLNFSSHYFTVRYHKSPQASALITSTASVVVIFMGPVVGYAIDKMGGQLHVCTVTSFLVIGAYYFLLHTQVSPMVPIILLSIGESFLPIVIMAMVPMTVEPTVYGSAFGVMEVTGSATSFAGNVLLGYLVDSTGSYEESVLLLLYLAIFGTGVFVLMSVAECFRSAAYVSVEGRERERSMNARGPIDPEALAAVDE